MTRSFHQKRHLAPRSLGRQIVIGCDVQSTKIIKSYSMHCCRQRRQMQLQVSTIVVEARSRPSNLGCITGCCPACPFPLTAVLPLCSIVLRTTHRVVVQCTTNRTAAVAPAMSWSREPLLRIPHDINCRLKVQAECDDFQ